MIVALDIDQLHHTRAAGKAFADEVKLHGGYDPARFEAAWSSLMDLGLANLFVATDGVAEIHGFLCASYIPCLYSGLPSAQVQCWYVDPEHRKGSTAVRLFSAFEEEAAKRGTKKFTVGHKVGINEEAMSGFFKRRGYTLGECLYWKNL